MPPDVSLFSSLHAPEPVRFSTWPPTQPGDGVVGWKTFTTIASGDRSPVGCPTNETWPPENAFAFSTLPNAPNPATRFSFLPTLFQKMALRSPKVIFRSTSPLQTAPANALNSPKTTPPGAPSADSLKSANQEPGASKPSSPAMIQPSSKRKSFPKPTTSKKQAFPLASKFSRK